jgi:hypothetical protein
MSLIARTQRASSYTWAPPESPLRIKYTSRLLREVCLARNTGDAFGILYGARHGSTIQLSATHGHAGLDAVGIFSSRLRGDVSLTPKDLARFEHAEASVALAIAGETGGFFVRDTSGFIDPASSPQTFPIHPLTFAQAVNTPTVSTHFSDASFTNATNWLWKLCIPAALLLSLGFIPRKPPLSVNLTESAGQMRISWNVPVRATLTILDGAEKTSIPITPAESMVTYVRRTGDVGVQLGSAQERYVGPPPPPAEIETMRSTVKALESKLKSLRRVQASGRTIITALEEFQKAHPLSIEQADSERSSLSPHLP